VGVAVDIYTTQILGEEKGNLVVDGGSFSMKWFSVTPINSTLSIASGPAKSRTLTKVDWKSHVTLSRL
jgi:hypothetical protein